MYLRCGILLTGYVCIMFMVNVDCNDSRQLRIIGNETYYIVPNLLRSSYVREATSAPKTESTRATKLFTIARDKQWKPPVKVCACAGALILIRTHRLRDCRTRSIQRTNNIWQMPHWSTSIRNCWRMQTRSVQCFSLARTS
jgi:hypothetical protein